MGDTRKIKILHTDEAVKLDAGNLKNVFSSSPDDCLGIEMTNPDDNLKFYEFRWDHSFMKLLELESSDIFNHPDCAAHCEYSERFDEKTNKTIPHQVCTTTIGYDDLYYTLPGSGTELIMTWKWKLLRWKL